MRFIKFLNEDVDTNIFNTISDTLKKDILRDCKKFLNDTKSNLILYRGMDNNENHIKFKTNKERTPKDSSIELHNLMNSIFKETFGINLRSESVFTSPNWKIVNDYGYAHMVFPIGDYKVIWSDKISDLYVFLNTEGYDTYPYLNELCSSYDEKYDEFLFYYLIAIKTYFNKKHKNELNQFNKEIFINIINNIIVNNDDFYIKFENKKFDNVRSFINSFNVSPDTVLKNIKCKTIDEIYLKYGHLNNLSFNEFIQKISKECLILNNYKKLFNNWYLNDINKLNQNVKGEVMLVCDEYYAIPVGNYFKAYNILDILKNSK